MLCLKLPGSMLCTIVLLSFYLSSTVDSDVDLIDVGSGGGVSGGRGQGVSPQSPGSTQSPHGVISSHQPIVHFEASVSVRARSPSYDYDVDLLPKELQTPKM